jgi:hypothetical protein
MPSTTNTISLVAPFFLAPGTVGLLAALAAAAEDTTKQGGSEEDPAAARGEIHVHILPTSTA